VSTHYKTSIKGFGEYNEASALLKPSSTSVQLSDIVLFLIPFNFRLCISSTRHGKPRLIPGDYYISGVGLQKEDISTPFSLKASGFVRSVPEPIEKKEC
jgi:hypothetical protein